MSNSLESNKSKVKELAKDYITDKGFEIDEPTFIDLCLENNIQPDEVLLDIFRKELLSVRRL